MQTEKECPLMLQARTEVRNIYLAFQKELSHQQGAATLTLAIVMKDLLLNLQNPQPEKQNRGRTKPKIQDTAV